MSARRLRRAFAGYVLAVGSVAVFTGIVAIVRSVADVNNVSMIYLLAVIASAVALGRGPAILAAISSFLAFNFFFLEPHYTLEVTDDEEWLALALLLITGVITGHLAALLRERAEDAEKREREAIVLYDVVRLLAEPDVRRALSAVADRLRAELRLAAVLIAVGGEGPMSEAAAGDGDALALARETALPDAILGAGRPPTSALSAAPGRWIRVVAPRSAGARSPARSARVASVPVVSNALRIGSLVIVHPAGTPALSDTDNRLLSTVAHQLGLAVERLRLQSEATEAEALRRTDELRTALVNAVSHEFRTPLSSIIASADSLLQGDVSWSEEENVQFAQAIVEEARRLDRLVSNLLDVSRIEAGNIRPEKGWYDLASLCNEVAGRLRPLTADHRVELDLPEDLPPVPFDYVQIDQVVTSLVENAAKHTPPGTTIRVSIISRGGWVEVAVGDSGPGVPREALAQVFKPFYRAEVRGTRASGTGLGLAVAKGFVEAHGGRIWVANGQDGGARFAFTLPLAEQPAAAA